MVAFASLFLSLIVGVQPVAFHVDESVSSVEVFVDGRSAGAVLEPPWTQPVDFGEALLPHEVVAVARDSGGKEVGRARQWVNLPRSPAETSLALEREGDRVFLRLEWESVVAAEPDAVRVTLDGVGVPVSISGRAAGGYRVELPEHDPDRLHFVRAELEFPRNVSSVAEMTFGGTYAGGSRTELTAVAVELRAGRKLPPIRDLQGQFRKNGEELTVVAVEEGPATVLVIRDQHARETLAELGRSKKSTKLRRRRLLSSGESTRVPRSLRDLMPLAAGTRLRFVWPVAKVREDAEPDLEVFDFSAPLDSRDGGLYWLLTKVAPPPTLRGEQRLADAVAVAGVVAARRNRRRVALLVLNPEARDGSRLEAATVRRYLEALMVPLVVWSPGVFSEAGEAGQAGQAGPAGNAAVWGESRDVSSLVALERAVAGLNRTLDRQRLVWVEGLHLPQDITVDADSKLTLAR
jgi:hypothetical protein